MTSPPPPAVVADGRDDRRPIAVLLVERRLYEDGATRVLLGLLQRWQRTHVAVRFLVLERRPPQTSAPLPAGLQLTYPASRELRLRWALVRGLARAVSLSRSADVVLSGREIGWGLLVARVASRVSRRPFAVLIQSEPGAAMAHHVPRRLRTAVRRSLISADRVICVSPGLVPALEEFGVDPRRISVVLNGVDVERVGSARAAAASTLPSGPGPLVVAVGRLTHQKGFDLLVRAHARVLAAGVPHRLLILGEGQDRRQLGDLAAELGVTASVHLPGFVDDPLPSMAAADLFCLPSRWEGSPLSLAEAMVLGVPTVAADCLSGPRHLLHDGAYGDLVPVDDVTSLAAALKRNLQELKPLQERAAAGREWAMKALDADRSARQLLDVLADTARSRG